MLTVAVTSACWIATAFAGPATDRRTLVEFYRKVRPFGPGWECIRREAGITVDEARASRENIPMALLGWVAGCTVIWSALFTVGNVLYRRWVYAGVLFAVFLVAGVVLLRVINRLWANNKQPAAG